MAAICREYKALQLQKIPGLRSTRSSPKLAGSIPGHIAAEARVNLLKRKNRSGPCPCSEIVLAEGLWALHSIDCPRCREGCTAPSGYTAGFTTSSTQWGRA